MGSNGDLKKIEERKEREIYQKDFRRHVGSLGFTIQCNRTIQNNKV